MRCCICVLQWVFACVMIRKKEIGIPCYNMPLQLNIHFKNRLKVWKRLCRFFFDWRRRRRKLLLATNISLLRRSPAAFAILQCYAFVLFSPQVNMCKHNDLRKKNATLRVKQDCISWRRRRDSNSWTAFDGYAISSRAPSTKLGDFSKRYCGEERRSEEHTSELQSQR